MHFPAMKLRTKIPAIAVTLIVVVALMLVAMESMPPVIASSLCGTQSYANSSSKSKRHIMLRFDDSLQDQWVNALPILAKYGFRAVFSTVVGVLRTNAVCTLSGGWQNASWAEIKWLYDHGNEIADHTMTHLDLTHQNLSGLQFQIVYSKTTLSNHGITNVPDFVLPYGTGKNNATVLNYIYDQGEFDHVFTAWGNPGILNYSAIQTVWIGIDARDNDTSPARFESIANQTSSTLVVGFLFHHLDDHVCCTQYYINTTDFAQDMAYLNSSGFTVILPWNLTGY